jgi:hypothetical protein
MNGKGEKIVQINVPGIGVFKLNEEVKILSHEIVNILGEETGVICLSTTGLIKIEEVDTGKGIEIECKNANTVGVPQCCKRWNIPDKLY